MIEELYKIKVIRDFLNLYSQHKWKSILANIIQIGILQLKNNCNIASLSDKDIAGLVDSLKSKATKSNTRDKINRSKSPRSTSEPNYKNASSNKTKIIKSSTSWRKGDNTQFNPSKSKERKIREQVYNERKHDLDSSDYSHSNASLNSDIYPKWWGENREECKISKQQKKKAKLQEKINNQTQLLHHDYQIEPSHDRSYNIEKMRDIGANRPEHGQHHHGQNNHGQNNHAHNSLHNNHQQPNYHFQHEDHNRPRQHNNQHDYNQEVRQKENHHQQHNQYFDSLEHKEKRRKERERAMKEKHSAKPSTSAQEVYVPKQNKYSYNNYKAGSNPQYDNVESRIKGKVENDRRLHSLLSRNEHNDDQSVSQDRENLNPEEEKRRNKYTEVEYTYEEYMRKLEKEEIENTVYKEHKENEPKQRKAVENRNNKNGVRTDYVLSFDKKMKPQLIRERSNSRSLSGGRNTGMSNQPVKPMNYTMEDRKYQDQKQPIQPSIKEDNLQQSQEEVSEKLSSYAPSERTKMYFKNNFQSQEMTNNSLDVSDTLN